MISLVLVFILIIINPYLNFNNEQIILFDNMSLNIKLNSYTFNNTKKILSLEFLYCIDFENLENKKVFINE